LEAAVRLLTRAGVALEFPPEQSCCGLPVEMMGEPEAAREVAARNVRALGPAAGDVVLTLCASCASHLTHAYPRLLADDPALARRAEAFAAKVMPFSRFAVEVLNLPAEAFQPGGPKATYHAPCHLCRGLGVRQAPKELILRGGFDLRPAAEEETCCGFGGTYSGKFPQVSAQILARKLADAEATGAEVLVTECPGCVMQLRGGARQQGLPLQVRHLAEVLEERLR
jgi:Fe-S oxidoreductase